MKRFLLPFIFLITLFKGFAQPCFISPATSYNIPNNGGITHDFNLDGKPDLAVLNLGTNSSTISILLATGNSAFSAATDYTIGTAVRQIITGDFNNDGITDIATSNRDVLLGNGIGGFSFATPTYTSTTNNTGIAAADFNNDGKTDVATISTNQVWVLLGNGSGIYTGGTFHNVGTNPKSITTNDFNGDGNSDLAVVNNSSNNISVLLGTGSGSFAPTVNYNIGSNLLSIATNDFNNDGNPDLAVGEGFSGSSGIVWILSGSTTGTFSTTSTFGVGGSPVKLVLSDINNDGFKDILTQNDENISVSIGSSTGTFSTATHYPAPFGRIPTSLNCADFNNDGKIDIALGVLSSIFIINGNGNGSFLSPISHPHINGFVADGPRCAADFNNDTFMDIAMIDGYNYVSLLLGSSSGTFTPTLKYTVGSIPVDIKNADFNNDGKMDLAVLNSNSNSISILIGNGNGTFLVPINYSLTGSTPKMSYLKDFNGDSKIDIAIIDNSATLFIMFGTGTGTFGSPVNTLFLGNPTHYVCADYNMDGILDFAAIYTTSPGYCEIKTYFGNGSGSFSTSSATSIYTGSFTNYYLITDDFNNDGKDDIALQGSGFIVLKSNGNGTFSQVASYSIGGMLGVLLPADFNNDGYIDLAAEFNPAFGNAEDGFVIFEGNGSGIFATEIFYPYTGVTQIASDFNNDGKVDLAGGAYSVFTTVLLNNGITNFTLSAVTNTLCIGSSVSMTAVGNGSFTWSTGAVGNSITVSPSATSTYSLTNQLTNGCSNTKTISVTVDNTCQDVWPGDANSDGVADNLDVLELGLHFTQTGNTRVTTSNNWQSYFSNNWVGTISNGKNLNHSDCNGDGIINNNDTLAIFNNYNLTHTFKVAQTTTINPQLTIVPDQVSVLKGTWGTASIYLGDNTANINNINGVAFTVDFDNTLIETNSIYIEYQNSFIDAGQNLHFRKLDFSNGKLFAASTHTINNNVNGFGKIATLHYKIKSTLASTQVLNLGISQANQSDISGSITPLTSGTGSLTATIDVGLQEFLNDNTVFLSPNPTNGLLTIKSKTEIQKIEVISITGQILLHETIKNNNHTLNLEHYSNGIYFVNIYQNDRIIKREKIMVNK